MPTIAARPARASHNTSQHTLPAHPPPTRLQSQHCARTGSLPAGLSLVGGSPQASSGNDARLAHHCPLEGPVEALLRHHGALVADALPRLEEGLQRAARGGGGVKGGGCARRRIDRGEGRSSSLQLTRGRGGAASACGGAVCCWLGQPPTLQALHVGFLPPPTLSYQLSRGLAKGSAASCATTSMPLTTRATTRLVRSSSGAAPAGRGGRGGRGGGVSFGAAPAGCVDWGIQASELCMRPLWIPTCIARDAHMHRQGFPHASPGIPTCIARDPHMHGQGCAHMHGGCPEGPPA